MTGQRAAQRKNSQRQWGRPFGRAPRENLSSHFDPFPLGRGLHHHVEVAGRWCRWFAVGNLVNFSKAIKDLSNHNRALKFANVINCSNSKT